VPEPGRGFGGVREEESVSKMENFWEKKEDVLLDVVEAFERFEGVRLSTWELGRVKADSVQGGVDPSPWFEVGEVGEWLRWREEKVGAREDDVGPIGGGEGSALRDLREASVASELTDAAEEELE
jgi:hypothetical protein